jgi:hypothetical protein
MRGNNCTTFSAFSSARCQAGKFSGSRLVRMKHNASLFSMSIGQWPMPYPLAKIVNLFESTILFGEKIA